VPAEPTGRVPPTVGRAPAAEGVARAEAADRVAGVGRVRAGALGRVTALGVGDVDAREGEVVGDSGVFALSAADSGTSELGGLSGAAEVGIEAVSGRRKGKPPPA